jgi:hypothetical protein
VNAEERLRRLGEDWASGLRGRYGKGTSRYVAGKFGISIRQAQRMLAGKAPRATAARSERLRGIAAASKIRATRQVRNPGNVRLTYDGVESPRSGFPRSMVMSGSFATDMSAIANILESGDFEFAGDQLDTAVLDEYGGIGGGSLHISDWEGFEFE